MKKRVGKKEEKGEKLMMWPFENEHTMTKQEVCLRDWGA